MATRKQLEKDIDKLTREFIRESAKHMRKNIKRALKCGALDIDSHKEGDYLIPRIIFQALLKEEAFQYKFHDNAKKYNRSAENVFNMM